MTRLLTTFAFAVFALALASCSSNSADTGEVGPSASGSSQWVSFDYIGELDTVKGELSIRPALPSEMSVASWSRITGLGSPPPTLNVTTEQLTPGINGGTLSGTEPEYYPGSYTCAYGHQCSYIKITQAPTNAVSFADGVLVIYDLQNGVTMQNAESLPSPTSLYAAPMPSGSYYRYGGGAAWSTFTWSALGNEDYARALDFNMNGAAGSTFHLQLWGIVNRTAYNSFSATASSFTDACSSGADVSAFVKASGGGAAAGYKIVNLDFPFSIYDNMSLGTPTTAQSFLFSVDGSLALNDDPGSPGTGNMSGLSANGTPKYGIYPYRTNFDITTGGQLCYLSAGTAPSRTITFTWKNVPFAAAPTSTATFSAVLHENTDRVDFQYGSVNPPSTVHVRAGLKGGTNSTVQCLFYVGSVCDTNVGPNVASNTSYFTTPSTPSYAGP